MHSRLHTQLCALTLLPAALSATGCVQATRHSNALIFGTNTSFGIKVGTDATQVPSVTVGYSRQEAVLVPVVANTGETATDGRRLNRLTPCDLLQPIKGASNGTYVVHPCSLVGVNGKAMDSYSVMASFGAQFDASGGTSNGAKGGLAQYFATGVAAQLLAATGGASVVSVGPAATASTLKAPPADQTIAALYGKDAAFTTGQGVATNFAAFINKLQAKIELTGGGAPLRAKVLAFESTTGSPIKIEPVCDNTEACKAAARDAYAIGYHRDAKKYEDALTAWTIP